MDDRQKTIAALTIIVTGVVLVVIVIGMVMSGRSIVSPVPDEGAIRVIFISPTPEILMTETPTPEAAQKPTNKPTVKPTTKPTLVPTKTATSSATP